MANQETTVTIYASFYEQTGYSSNAQLPAAGLYLKPLSIQIDEAKNEVPSFTAEFSFTAPEFYGSGYEWHHYIRRDRRVTFYAVHHYDSPFTQIPLGTFIIEDIQKNFTADARTLTISGPGLLYELVGKLLFYPIGVYKTNLTYIATAVPAPTATTLSQAAAAGAEQVVVSSLSGFGVDDEVRITMDGGGIHVTQIAEVNGSTVKLAAKLPAAAGSGKTVRLRKRKITVTSAALFYEGDVVKIRRDHPNNLVHDGYLIEKLDGNAMTLNRGLLDSAAAGNYVQREDYSEPTAGDITSALAGWNFLTPWTAAVQAGRTSKTSLATKGASIFATLKQIADIHGEYFISDCMTSIAAGDPVSLLPKRKIIWRTSCRDSGIKLVQPRTDAEGTGAWNDKTKAIIVSVTERIPRQAVDTLYVKGAGAGVNQISLYDSDQATRDAVLTPNAFVMSGEEGDIYKPVKLVAALVNVWRESILNIDVLPESASPEDLGAAANMMLRQAANHLKVVSGSPREFQVQAIGRVLIRPGDIVRMDYQNDDFDVVFTDTPMQVIHASTDVNPDGIFYDLTVSTSLLPNEAAQPTDEATVAAEIIRLQQLREAFNAAPAAGNLRTAAYVGTTLPPPTGGTSYLPGDGIAITGSTLSVRAGDLLGEHITAAGNDFAVTTVTMAGDGLESLGNKLKARLQANSGLVAGVSGLALGTPAPLSAGSLNHVTGANHGHAVTAFDNHDTNPGQLFKSDTAGAGTLRKLTATSELRSPLLTAPGHLQISPAGPLTQTVAGAWNVSATANSAFSLGNNRLDLQGHLRFTHASPVIDTGSATPLTLAPTAQLNLNPAGDTVFQWGVNSKVRSSTYQSQVQGWAFSYGTSGGHLDVRTLFADEFHVKAFIAELEMALAGGFRITKSRGIVSRPLTLPATTGQTTTVYFHDIPGWEGIAIFDRRQDDIVAMSYVDIGSSAAMGGICYGVVNRNSYTNHATTREQSWTITWTYLLTGNIAGGKKVAPGTPILDYGLPPAMHFIEANTLDPAASPYLRSVSIEEVNATTKAPTVYDVHFQAGALANLPDVGQEYGVFAGRARTHAHALFTDQRAELHNASFTLYGNVNSDNLYLRINAAEVDTSTATSRAPLTDQVVTNVLKTGGTTFESNIDEEFSALDGNYLWNNPGQSAAAAFTLESIAGTPTSALVRVNLSSLGTVTYGDDMELRAQLFRSNGTTPITEEIVVARWGASGTITAHFNQLAAGSVWTGAQLRLRWDYFPALSTPTIKLDPAVPSLAIGNPLPTGFVGGGDGIWAGRDSDNLYKMRIGSPTGVGLRYNGADLRLVNANGNGVIVLGSDGSAYFDRPVTLGATEGGLWQGTGTFANPTTGLKIWRDGNVGRLATYNNGVQVELDGTGRLLAGQGAVVLSKEGIALSAMFLPDEATVTHKRLLVGPSRLYGTILTADGSTAAAWSLNGTNSTTQVAAIQLSSLSATTGAIALQARDIGLQAAQDLSLTATRDILLNASANGSNGVIVQSAKTILAQEAYDWDILELRSSDIDHGLSAVTHTGNFGALGKNAAATGGLLVRGLTETIVALNLAGYQSTPIATTGTGANGAVQISGFLKSGTSAGDLGPNDNLLAVRNNLTTRFIVKGNGNFHYDGTGTAYDDHDDVGLLRALSRETFSGTVAGVWDRFVTYNRDHLIAAGVLSEAGFINGAALDRLLVGAVWQMHERLAALEQRLSSQSTPVG
jgi:hypothetical protein